MNVEFTSPGDPVDGTDGHLLMRVYERGSAETLSCGTGACAVAAVALRDAARGTGTITVDVPGGRLTVTVTDDSCWLSGPAVLVATGTLTLPDNHPHPPAAPRPASPPPVPPRPGDQEIQVSTRAANDANLLITSTRRGVLR